MRILQVTRLPDRAVCYWQKVVWWLTEELVRRGHEVSLVTSESFADRRERKTHRSGTYVTGPLASCVNSASQFDVIHLHCERPEEVPSARFRLPLIATVHAAEANHDAPANASGVSHPLISVFGQHELWLNKHPNWWGNIPYSAPRRRFQLSESRDYLLFDGSQGSDSRVEEALSVAHRSRRPLKIVASNPDESDRLRRMFGDDSSVEVFEGIDEDERLKLLAEACGLIIPHTRRSGASFLTAMEALALGTPTITSAGGALDDLILNGVTGFLFETLDHAAMQALRLDELHRPACRAHFERFYTVEKTVDRYETMYERLLRSRSSRPSFLTEASHAG